jgi:hypothetical protein
MFFRNLAPAAAAAMLLLPRLASAQVAQFVDCNPMEEENCDPMMALGTDHNFNFNQSVNRDLWETKAGSPHYDPETGMRLQIAKQGESTTLMSKFYIFWGRVELIMRCAPGTGIISSVMLLSDTLDEVDWEILGSNSTHASTNYFGKGVEDFTNGAYHPAAGLRDEYHNFTIVWTEDALKWYINDDNIRTLLPADANNTKSYPQTPMRISMSLWAGGDPSLPEGTRQWAGGDTNYDEGPFYMYVKSAHVADFSNGKEYKFLDQSGSAESVQVVEGKSESVEIIERPPPEPEKSMGDRWNELSDGAKYGIYGGAAAAGILIFGTLMWYCIRQRRAGAAEAKRAAVRDEADRAELSMLKSKGIDPDSFTAHGQEYKGAQTGVSVNSGNAYNAVPSSPHSPQGPDHQSFSALDGMAAAGAVGAVAGARGMADSRPGSSASRGPANPFASYDDRAPGSAHSSHNPNPFASYNDSRSAPGSAHSNNNPNPYASYDDQYGPGPGAAYGRASPASMHRTESHASSRAPPAGPLPPAPGSYRMGSPNPSRMGSPNPDRVYGVPSDRIASPGPNRMNSPAPSQSQRGSPGPGNMYGQGANRMNSPAPSQSLRGSPGPGNMYGQGPNRMNSPAPSQHSQMGGPDRQYVAGPRSPVTNGPPRAFSNSPGPRSPRHQQQRPDDYWNQEGGYN